MTRLTLTRRAVAAATVLLALSGCKSWHPTTASPREVLAAERPRTVRITDTDGSVVTVRRPMIRNDSIVTSERTVLGTPKPVLGVAYGEVDALEVERFDGKKTLVGAALGVTATALWASLARQAEGGFDPGEPRDPKDLQLDLVAVVRLLTGALR